MVEELFGNQPARGKGGLQLIRRPDIEVGQARRVTGISTQSERQAIAVGKRVLRKLHEDDAVGPPVVGTADLAVQGVAVQDDVATALGARDHHRLFDRPVDRAQFDDVLDQAAESAAGLVPGIREFHVAVFAGKVLLAVLEHDMRDGR